MLKEDAFDLIENALNQSTSFLTSQSTNEIQLIDKLNTHTNISFANTSLTGSERMRPQIRVFTKLPVALSEKSIINNEKFFFLIHCATESSDLKIPSTIDFSKYILSLEGVFDSKTPQRIDIRSLYDILLEKLQENSDLTNLKIDRDIHNLPSIFQATFFKLSTDNMDNFVNYINYYDSRTSLIANGYLNVSPPALEDDNINQMIYYGAPGTGKSFEADSEILKTYPNYKNISHGDSSFVFKTTIHPEYSYHDFIGQIMPTKNGPDITYDFQPGIFTLALDKALKEENNKKKIYLVIEEMSRGNISSVFGDIFQLLDRKDGISEYPINNLEIAEYIFNDKNHKIFIPANLSIIGTVNTSDQNVFVMDTAFKRRFDFIYIDTQPIKDSYDNYLNDFEIEIEDDKMVSWVEIYQKINEFITLEMGLPEDKQIGQFFLKDAGSTDTNRLQFQNKVLQYLWQDIETAAIYTDSSKKLFPHHNTYSKLYTDFKNRSPILNPEIFTLQV